MAALIASFAKVTKLLLVLLSLPDFYLVGTALQPRSKQLQSTLRNSGSTLSSVVKKDETMATPAVPTKPRILCLHGMSQSGASFSNKIGGARRKLSRLYDLDFLDGPVVLPNGNKPDDSASSAPPVALGWWIRNSQGQHENLEVPFNYIREHVRNQTPPKYDAILGFSQGGLLATALAISGDDVPGIRAIVTAGAPFVEDTFTVARQRQQSSIGSSGAGGMSIPKLHFAGSTDEIIPVARVEALCQEGGTGKLIMHDKGHLFPTKAAAVQEMLDFLEEHVLIPFQSENHEVTENKEQP